jgi:hypothetical protein
LIFLAEGYCQRQAYVAQADYGYGWVCHFSWLLMGGMCLGRVFLFVVVRHCT